jgi:hypothetical protein
VTTEAASEIQPTAAKLNGHVNPNGVDTHYYFEYGPTTSYGTRIPAGEGMDLGSGTSTIYTWNNVSGLKPGTIYHYRLVGTNASGAINGSDQTFTTPGPVEAVTSSASSIAITQAELNGTVNPKGYDARYYFQYGKTTSYGSTTAESDAGSGSGSTPVNATVSGLEPGTSIHYRLVATSGGVTSYGSDVTFTTLLEQHSNPTFAIRNNNSGHQSVYYVGSEHAIWEWAWYTGKGWEQVHIGGEAESGTTPSAVTYESTQARVYYTGVNHAIWELAWNGSAWSSRQLGGEVEAGTSPSATTYLSGQMRVYYTSKKHEICEWGWLGTEWTSRCLGGEVEAGTSPSATTYLPNQMRVYYTGKNHQVCEWGWLGTEWAPRCLGGEVEAGTSPSAFAYLSNQIRAYYTGKNHEICEWGWLGTEWAARCLGGAVEAGASPGASAYLANQVRIYYASSKHEICEWGWLGAEWAARCLGGVAPEAKARPAVLLEPYSGEASIYYRSGSGSMVCWSWSGTEWSNTVL